MIALVFALGVTAAEPTLKEVLARAAVYVESFEAQLSALAGEETYVQEVSAYDKGGCPSGSSAGTYQATMGCTGRLVNAMRTELHSHLLLVRNGPGYLQYRDVFEVDGRVVGDRAERFTRLFGDRSITTDEQKRRILADSARFNIGDVYREMNIPLLAMQFLSAENQWRFSFKRTKNTDANVGKDGDTTPPGTFRIATNVWVLEYEERGPGTLIRTTQGRDIKSRGRLWVEAETGRVMMTEHLTKVADLETSVTVSFKSEPLRGLLVPVEMRERYRKKRGSAIDAVATYGRFAPFTLK